MNFKISTALLQTALNKVQKGLGNGKILPITNYFNFELEEGSLFITSTNLNHFMTYKIDGVEGEDGSVVIPSDAIIKLASKTTVPEISFKTKDTNLEIKGNGNYKIPFLSEAFPEYEFDYGTNTKVLNTIQLQNIFKVNKSAIAVDMVMPCLTGYYLGEKSITTDGVKMCLNNVKVFDEPVLISQDLADLINVLDGDKVSVSYNEGKLMIETPNITIFGAELAGKDQYPDISGVLGLEYPHVTQVKKADMLNVLDRLSIFVTQMDNFGVFLTFKADGIHATDAHNNNLEIIPYASNRVNEEVKMLVNLNYMHDLILVLPTDVFELHYGHATTLKIVDGAVSEILGLLNNEEA